MIDSVDRIRETPVRDCPALVEGILPSEGIVLRTAWFSIEPFGKPDSDVFRITSVDDGVSLLTKGDLVVKWLQPEDMNSPAIQAELMLGLREMGMEL
jgi:hypothetical protein